MRKLISALFAIASTSVLAFTDNAAANTPTAEVLRANRSGWLTGSQIQNIRDVLENGKTSLLNSSFFVESPVRDAHDGRRDTYDLLCAMAGEKDWRLVVQPRGSSLAPDYFLVNHRKKLKLICGPDQSQFPVFWIDRSDGHNFYYEARTW